jgi:hypothetical protein
VFFTLYYVVLATVPGKTIPCFSGALTPIPLIFDYESTFPRWQGKGRCNSLGEGKKGGVLPYILRFVFVNFLFLPVFSFGMKLICAGIDFLMV